MTRHYAHSQQKLIHQRKQIIEDWLGLKSQGVDDKMLQKVFHISRATFFRWNRLYISKGISSLRIKSRKPHRVRKPEVITKEVIAVIRSLREQYPFFGKVKIHALCVEKGLSISLSSVGRTLHYLMQRGIITPVVVLKANKERKFIRKFTTTHSKRLPKHHKSPIQLDHTIINLRGTQHRVFVAYDRSSKYCLCKSYHHATADNAADFLSFMSQHWPYTPTELQVDGGSEFRGNFETACQLNHIKLFVLPPRSPKLNGGVERYNQTLQDEFFLPNYNTLPTQINELNAKLQAWSDYYNNFRPHRSLTNRQGLPISPCQFLKQSSLICTEP